MEGGKERTCKKRRRYMKRPEWGWEWGGAVIGLRWSWGSQEERGKERKGREGKKGKETLQEGG